MKYQKEYDFLVTVVKDAYENVIKGAKFVANEKGTKDLVTTLDVACEKYIISRIKELFPDDHIVSEEGNANKKLVGRCWLIDPIDGTNNFANGLPLWVIQMAFVDENEPVCSVVYAPIFDEVISAHVGEGVYLNGVKQPKVKEKPANQLLIGTAIDHAIKPLFFNPKTIPLYLKTRMFGSAGYSFSSVALGRFGGYIVQALYPWDTVPGVLLCREAGIEVYQKDIQGRHISMAINNKKFVKAVNFESLE